MKFLSVLIKPASSLCNLRCRYCFYEDVSRQREQMSYGVMTKGVMKHLIDRIFEAVDEDGTVVFAFQGGEPTLAGLSYYREFVVYVDSKKKNRTICYVLQTNGTLLDDEWGVFFRENQFLVGVSLDGYESNTNEFRIDSEGSGIYRNIMNGIDAFETIWGRIQYFSSDHTEIIQACKGVLFIFKKSRFFLCAMYTVSWRIAL